MMSVSPNRTTGEAVDKSEPAQEEEEAEGEDCFSIWKLHLR